MTTTMTERQKMLAGELSDAMDAAQRESMAAGNPCRVIRAIDQKVAGGSPQASTVPVATLVAG
jgi:hypothetical protein